jgi:outer membrane protein OmpA-like peptidoglycan-associated protein
MPDAAMAGVVHETLPNSHAPPVEDGLAELRKVLVGPTQSQLAALQERLDNPALHAEEICRVLPAAVRLRADRDTQLAMALLPVVEEALQISVRKDPRTLVDALFPVMGPAIRKAITAALRGMIQSFNQALESSLSPQGLQWRLEAWRTGKPFAEIVLLHTLLYRVEQVFLIHKNTGLLLHHVGLESTGAQHADLVSGMLTAIQDFVQDSFGVPAGETLDTLQVGEFTVWLEVGPQALLAGVIRGYAPLTLRSIFQDAIERIHQEQAGTLSSFTGDPAPFAASRPDLEACLQAQYATASSPQKSPVLAWAAVAIIVIIATLSVFFSLRESRRWAAYLTALRTEPGIVVTTAEEQQGQYFVSGLRDPLAKDPTLLLQEAKLPVEKVVSHWEPYHALHPDFILARAQHVLQPPASVTLAVDDDVLRATGTASHQWIVETRVLVRALPGIHRLQENGLVDADAQAFTADIQYLERQVLRFVKNTTDLAPGQDDMLQALVSRLHTLGARSSLLGKAIRIEIVGHTDKDGPDDKNLKLSQDRADLMAARLRRSGVRTIPLTARGVGIRGPLRQEVTEQDREFNRSVSFKVLVTDTR